MPEIIDARMQFPNKAYLLDPMGTSASPGSPK